MKNPFKKQIGYLAVALLLSSLLCGCGNSQKSDDSKQQTQIEKSKQLDEQQK